MPPVSLTPVIWPATSAALLMVMVAPGTTAPCSSAAFTRMLPVCTWAATGADRSSAAAKTARVFHRVVIANLPACRVCSKRPTEVWPAGRTRIARRQGSAVP